LEISAAASTVTLHHHHSLALLPHPLPTHRAHQIFLSALVDVSYLFSALGEVMKTTRKVLNYLIAVIVSLCCVCLIFVLAVASSDSTISTPTPQVQMPIEQIIANTAAAAQTQTYAVASPVPSFTSFDYTTPSAIFQATLAPTWTPEPTATSFILTYPTQSSGSSGAVCSCAEDTLNCKDFPSQSAAQACYNYCVSNGYGDIHRLDQGGQPGVACESLP